MPGYDSERFVDLSQSDKEELMCSICQDILCAPVVAKCCRQTFCEDCINNWLSSESTCPYDRQPLGTDGLSPPPRYVSTVKINIYLPGNYVYPKNSILLNMLSKLNMTCDFKDNGCKEVVTLEQLAQHRYRCPYGLGKCKQCLCSEQKYGHNCLQSLLQTNRKFLAENRLLKHELLLSMASTSGVSGGAVDVGDEILVATKELQRLIDENIELKAAGDIGSKRTLTRGAGGIGDEPPVNAGCCVI
ncbi:unnamed protein product, partial [Medioppia subpectinata]